MRPGVRVDPRRATLTPERDGGSTVALPMVARGTVKVGGRVWPYVRGRFWILATERPLLASMGPTQGPPFDDATARAVTEAHVGAPVTAALIETNGKSLREGHAMLVQATRLLERDDIPMRLGAHVYDFAPLALVQVSLSDTERVAVGELGDVLRIDGPRVRFALKRMHADAVPLGEMFNPTAREGS